MALGSFVCVLCNWCKAHCKRVRSVCGRLAHHRYDNSEPVVDKHDSEYQEHMKKVYNDDKEGIKRGASFACGICHMVAATTKTAVQAKVPEAKIQEILLTSCQRMSKYCLCRLALRLF